MKVDTIIPPPSIPARLSTSIIPITHLAKLVDYNPTLGQLIWKKSGGSRAKQSCRVGSTSTKDGYRRFECRYLNQRVVLLEHRAIWALVHNYWPTELDHKNGDYQDNRIDNLRVVTRQQNTQNASRRSDSTSGVTGVSWNARKAKWEAYINVNKKRIKLGYFYFFKDAVFARKAAEIKFGFHPNHGRGAAQKALTPIALAIAIQPKEGTTCERFKNKNS